MEVRFDEIAVAADLATVESAARRSRARARQRLVAPSARVLVLDLDRVALLDRRILFRLRRVVEARGLRLGLALDARG